MLRYSGALVVRFHGGFLDGKVTRGNDPLTGDILDYWNAKRFFATTAGLVGAYMRGVSDDDFGRMLDPHESAPTVALSHRYRVTSVETIAEELTIDASYEFASE